MVAFSRSSSPSEPTSWLSEMCTSPSSRVTISAACNSCRAETGANTLVITTPWAEPPTLPMNRASAPVSIGDRARPSNSMPPSTISAPTDTAPARSLGHSNIGLMPCVAGPPSLTTATRRSFLRSSTAFVAWVVPSMTWVIRPGSAPGALSAASMAAMMPPVMSGVHGTLALAITRSAGSMMTASVLVPPTSMPRRQSGAGTGELLDRQVLEVVTEGPRPGDLDPRLGPPDRVTGESDHRDPLPVADPLGRDRIRRLAVQHRDQVRHGGQHPAALERHEILVLQFQPEQPAQIVAKALDHHAAPDKAARRMPLDVRHLAGHQPERADLRDQRGYRAALRARYRLADPDGQRHRAPHGRGARLRGGEGELGRAGRAAELDRRGPLQPLHPMTGDRPEHDEVAALVGHHRGARRDSRQVHGD